MQEYRKNLGKVSLTAEGAWTKDESFDILSIVYDEHTLHGFISKQFVPKGVDLYNKEYWMPFNVSGYSDNNIIILSEKTSETTIKAYTLEEAINSVATVGRRPGMILGFYNENTDRLDIGGRWEIWQFNSTTISEWEDVAHWQNIYYSFNKFVGWYRDVESLKKYNPFPEIGCYAYVGTEFNEATIYRCDTKFIWTDTTQHAWDYIKVIVQENVTVGENGNWFNDGVDTGIPASIKGENGKTPVFRQYDNTIQYSFDNVNWITISDKVAAWFRWNATTGDTQANNVGRIQISRDNVTWTNLSGDIINKLHISRYIGADESLPTSGIAEGTIYAKGPTYAEDDTLNDNPIYRLWVYAWKDNTLAWQDNGEFTSIAAGVVQETGDSETEVMSQKATTEKLTELASQSKVLNFKGKGDTLIKQPVKLTAGRVYQIKLSTTSWDITEVPDGYTIFGIEYNIGEDINKVLLQINATENKKVLNTYTITAEYNLCYYLIYRANNGSELNITIDDVTSDWGILQFSNIKWENGIYTENPITKVTNVTTRANSGILQIPIGLKIRVTPTNGMKVGLKDWDGKWLYFNKSIDFTTDTIEYIVEHGNIIITVCMDDDTNFDMSQYNTWVNFDIVDWKGYYDNIGNSISLINNQIEDKLLLSWIEGVRAVPNLISQANRITISEMLKLPIGTHLKYNIRNGYKCSFTQWDGDSSNFNEDSGMVQGQGTIITTYPFVNINMGKVDEKTILTSDGEWLTVIKPIKQYVETINNNLSKEDLSKIFNVHRLAWNPERRYVSWAFGGLFYDDINNNSKICQVYSSREEHVNTPTSALGDVMFRFRYEYTEWSEPIIVANHEELDEEYDSCRCMAANVASNGNYIALVLCEPKGGNQGDVYMYVSEDEGYSWINRGAVLLNGEKVFCSEAGSLFRSKSGRLFSFVSTGIVDNQVVSAGQVMYSDNNGNSWIGVTMPDEMGYMEGSFVELSDSEIWCIARGDETYAEANKPKIAKSTDNGLTWEFVGKTTIAASDSNVAQVKVGDFVYLLAGDRWMYNGLMYLRLYKVSLEDYKSNKFNNSVVLGKYPIIRGGFIGDFSYPAIIKTNNTLVGMYYNRYSVDNVGLFELIGDL